jgi:hypothetical protein
VKTGEMMDQNAGEAKSVKDLQVFAYFITKAHEKYNA